MASLIEYNLQITRKRPYFLLTFKITTFNALFSITILPLCCFLGVSRIPSIAFFCFYDQGQKAYNGN